MAQQCLCQRCGGSFSPRASGGKPQIFCSRQCRSRQHGAAYLARRAPVRAAACAECAGAVTQPISGRPRKYCSDKCRQRAANRAQRRRRRPAPKAASRICGHCGAGFDPKRRDQVYCEARCARNASQMRRHRGAELRQGLAFERQCVECSGLFTAKKDNAKWCSNICRIRTSRRDESRRRTPGSGGSLYSDLQIFERDGWICQICYLPVDRSIARTDPDGATIDHVIPISVGGTDDSENVATAHWRCNREKSDRVRPEDLAAWVVRRFPDLVTQALQSRREAS